MGQKFKRNYSRTAKIRGWQTFPVKGQILLQILRPTKPRGNILNSQSNYSPRKTNSGCLHFTFENLRTILSICPHTKKTGWIWSQGQFADPGVKGQR